MAYTNDETITLSRVNVPLAQTWNKLRINSITLEVPRPLSKGEVYQRVPRLFDAVDAGLGPEAVAWLVDACNDSEYFEVPAGAATEEPILINVNGDEGRIADVGIHVREGATAFVCMVASSSEGTDKTSASLVRIICEDNAHVVVSQVVACDEGHQHVSGLGIKLGEKARAEVRQYFLGGGRVAAGFACELAGHGSVLDEACRYAAAGTEVIDLNHLARARGRNTRETMISQGFLGDSAHKALRQTIDLVHGCRGSVGNESDTVVVTGDGVINKTLPTILCDEDDVQGNHGATIGSVSTDQLGYLGMRGLTQEEAEQLFVRAIYEDALMHAMTAEAHEAVLTGAERRFGAEVAAEMNETL